MQTLKVMDRTGHSTIQFDKADPASLKLAQDKVDEILAAGGRVAKNLGDGVQELQDKFDPNANDQVVFRHLVGG